MKNMKFVLLLVLSICFGVASFAQKTRPSTAKKRTAQKKTSNKKSTTKAPTKTTPPTVVAAPSAPPVDTTPKNISLRNDNSFQIADKDASKARNPLAYENFRKDDQAYMQRVWEEINVKEKMNRSFNYKGMDDNGQGALINVLLKAISDSKDPRKSKEPIVAFQDDRFTTPLDDATLAERMQGTAPTTVYVTNPNDPKGPKIPVTTPGQPFNPDEVITYRIKGDWVFDKESSVMKYRLLAISPVRTYDPANTGANINVSMFWIYYPDVRAALAKFDVYNPKNMGQRMTWEELFEGRHFSSYITKSTMDNPEDLRLKDLYEKSTITQLYEGQRIKEKIQDYEQNLWSY